MNIKLGDIVVFKGQGFIYQTLGRLLYAFENAHRNPKEFIKLLFKGGLWGWHTAFISKIENDKVTICEALAKGVCENPLPKDREYRVYRWFDREPPQSSVNVFVKTHLKQKYDILVYPLTAIAYLVRHYWGKPIPRLFDNSWSCWELIFYFADKMGQSFTESYDFPLLTDFLKLHPTLVLNHSKELIKYQG